MRWLSDVREKWLAWLHDRSGIAAAFTAIIMAVLLGFAAMVIDVGHVMVARGELQNAADAAALAGARGYFPNFPPSGPLTPNCTDAKTAAVNYVNQNYADADPNGLSIDPGDIKTGVWSWSEQKLQPFGEGTCSYTPGEDPDKILGIQVTVRKNSGALNNNPVAMTLAAIFGVTKMNVSAQAVAVNDLPLAGNIKCGTFLFAIPNCLANAACDASDKKYTVRFSNDPNDTAGWASFVTPVNANDQRCLAESIAVPCGGTVKGGCNPSSYCQPLERVKPCPGGTPVYAQNGVDNTVIQALADSLAQCGSLTVLIPVVQGGEGTNCTGVKWNGTKCMVGYAEMVIDLSAGGHVNPGGNWKQWVPPIEPDPTDPVNHNNEIQGSIRCLGDWKEGPPGDPLDYYGTVSLVPKLVK